MHKANESRKGERKEVAREILVSDALLGTMIGHLVNISEDGFMLLGSADIRVDHLYQLVFKSEDQDHTGLKTIQLSLGAECLWLNETGSGSKNWAGFRIIDIGDDEREQLQALYR